MYAISSFMTSFSILQGLRSAIPALLKFPSLTDWQYFGEIRPGVARNSTLSPHDTLMWV